MDYPFTGTIAENVHIFDEAFYMPQLQRSRRIWLYLPPEYSYSERSYPVMYMHDGQNLFDAATAFGGEEWGIDETINRLKNKCIIVGIENGGSRRIHEYRFHHSTEHGPGEGMAYVSFIVDTLKPCIDNTFRTLAGRENTLMAGSSLGGLVSFYAAMYHPRIFGGAGIFSPAFWIEPHIANEMKAKAAENQDLPQRFYFYAGGLEEKLITGQMKLMHDLLKQYPQYQLKKTIDSEGAHNEASWRSAFPQCCQWLLQPAKFGKPKSKH